MEKLEKKTQTKKLGIVIVNEIPKIVLEDIKLELSRLVQITKTQEKTRHLRKKSLKL